MRRCLTLTCIGLAAVTVSACQPRPSLTLTRQTQNYAVQLDLDAATLGLRTATIQVSALNGRGPAIKTVKLMPSMRDMHMLGPEFEAARGEGGRYQAQGEFFTMLGKWEIDVRIVSENAQEVAVFKVTAVP